jgi:hypothetical protein
LKNTKKQLKHGTILIKIFNESQKKTILFLAGKFNENPPKNLSK